MFSSLAGQAIVQAMMFSCYFLPKLPVPISDDITYSYSLIRISKFLCKLAKFIYLRWIFPFIGTRPNLHSVGEKRHNETVEQNCKLLLGVLVIITDS